MLAFKFLCLLLVSLAKIVGGGGLEESDSGEMRKQNSFLSGLPCYRTLLLLFLHILREVREEQM